MATSAPTDTRFLTLCTQPQTLEQEVPASPQTGTSAYTPPAKPGEPWNRSYPRAWWDERPNDKPSRAALFRAYQALEELCDPTNQEARNA